MILLSYFTDHKKNIFFQFLIDLSVIIFQQYRIVLMDPIDRKILDEQNADKNSDKMKEKPIKKKITQNLFKVDPKKKVKNTVKSGENPKKRYYSQKNSNTTSSTGKHKVFDKGLSDKFDSKARDIIKKCLGKGIMDNPQTYGEDMIVITNKIPYGYIELQVYGKWVDTFPHPMPYIYERKMKFNPNTLFVCFNANFSKAIIFGRKCVQEKKYRVEKYSREYIHYVPWNKTLTLDVSQINYENILSYASPEDYFEYLEKMENNVSNGVHNSDNINNTDNIDNIDNIEDIMDIF